VSAVLRLSEASYRHPGATVDSLREVSLALAAGSRTTLLGPTESGLTSLCLVLSGLAPRVAGGELRGALLLDGEDVRDRPMHRLCESVVLGVSQPAAQLSLVADTVYEEVAFGPANLGLPRGEVMERTERALDALAVGELGARDPRRLSGGQQQLVALAGLLAMRPRVVLLDDPLAHLDARGASRVLAALEAFSTTGTAVLLASHDADRVVRDDQRVLLMDGGRIVREGSAPEILSDPATWALGVAEPAAPRLLRLLGLPEPLGLAEPAASPATVAPGSAKLVPDLEIQGLCFAYPSGRAVLDEVDLAIPGGQVVGLVGPNGSGKTTLARHLVGLLRPDTGRVLLDGHDIASRRVAELASLVALGFQDPDRQVFSRRVRDEVAFGPRQLGIADDGRARAVDAALVEAGLTEAADRHPQDLGGAARKMLAIASLLAMGTPVLVLDEPTVGLDAAGVDRVRHIVHRLRAEGRTAIVISHDLRFVAETCERVVLLEQGRISLDGSPAEVFAEARWPVLRAAGLEPPAAAVLGARLGLGSTPTEAALLAAAGSRRSGWR
jgi:energy-coupling factor transport system ATP-binding protein